VVVFCFKVARFDEGVMGIGQDRVGGLSAMDEMGCGRKEGRVMGEGCMMAVWGRILDGWGVGWYMEKDDGCG